MHNYYYKDHHRAKDGVSWMKIVRYYKSPGSQLVAMGSSIAVGGFSFAMMIFAHLPLTLVPPLCNRFFFAGGMTRSVSEWMWRRRNVAASEQKPRRVYSSRVAPLLVCALLLLPYIPLPSFSPLVSRSWTTLDARRSSLRSVTGRV